MTTKHPTHLVVDGSNIATEGRNTPSLEQLDEAVRAILDEFPHERLTVVVDATFGHRIAESERDAYEEAILAGEIVAPPAGAIGRGDAFILQVADKAGATVFSNDSFQEFHGEHEWLFDDGRLIGGKPVPGVGWVFVPRVPVRGPLSRRAVRESKRGKVTTRRTRDTAAQPKRGRQANASATTASATASAAASLPMPKPSTPPPVKRSEPAPAAAVGPAGRADLDDSNDSDDWNGSDEATRRPPANGDEALNQPTVFLSFITHNRIGSIVEAVVDHFSSHGAYLVAGGARCYLPTKTMGDPPPNRARDVISRGDVVRVEVQSLDAERRGINVRFVELVESRELAERRTESATDHGEDEPPESADEVLSIPAQLPRSDTDVATRRTAAKRAAVKRAPSGRPVEELAERKAPAKKAAAEATPSPRAVKAAARKAPAKRATTRRRATADDVAPLDERPSDEPTMDEPVADEPAAPAAGAKKTAARRTTKKAAAQATATDGLDAGETDAAAEAPPAKKATRATAKKAARKTVAKAGAKKAATAKKASATKKASTRKAAAAPVDDEATAAAPPAKKATARKATARKSTAAKATTKKTAAKVGTATASSRTRSTAAKKATGTTARGRSTKKAAAGTTDS